MWEQQQDQDPTRGCVHMAFPGRHVSGRFSLVEDVSGYRAHGTIPIDGDGAVFPTIQPGPPFGIEDHDDDDDEEWQGVFTAAAEVVAQRRIVRRAVQRASLW